MIARIPAFVNAPAVAAHTFLNVQLDIDREGVVLGHADIMRRGSTRG